MKVGLEVDSIDSMAGVCLKLVVYLDSMVRSLFEVDGVYQSLYDFLFIKSWNHTPSFEFSVYISASICTKCFRYSCLLLLDYQKKNSYPRTCTLAGPLHYCITHATSQRPAVYATNVKNRKLQVQ